MGICDHTEKDYKEENNYTKEDEYKKKGENNSKEDNTNEENGSLNNTNQNNIIQDNSSQNNIIQDNSNQNIINQDNIAQDNAILANENQIIVNPDTTSQDNSNQYITNQDTTKQDNTNQDNNNQSLKNNIEDYNNQNLENNLEDKKEDNNKKEVGNKANEEDKEKEDKNNTNEDCTKKDDNKKEKKNNKEEHNDKNIKDGNKINEESNKIKKDYKIENSKNGNIKIENDKKENANLVNIKKENEKLKFVMKNAFCKIKLNDNELGKGVFCIIPFPNKNNPILVLITKGLIIKKNKIQGQFLTIKLNENKETFFMQIDNNRLIHEDKDNDIIIIEMKNYFSSLYTFTIDDDLNIDKCEDIYNKKYILLIDYSFKENYKLEFNFEYILGFNNINRILSENENKFKDGIIINPLNNKIIGIIKKKSASLLNKSIIEFYEKYKKAKSIQNNHNLKVKSFQPVFLTNTIMHNNNVNTNINTNIYSNINSNINNKINNNINANIINNNNNKINNINNNNIPKIINSNINNNNNNNKNINNFINGNINNEINNNINNNIFTSLNIKETKNYSSYIKYLLISFYYIDNLRKYFVVKNNFKNKKCDLANSINLYMNYYSQKNFKNCDNVVSNLNIKINQLNNYNNLNLEQLIDFFLNKLHEELNKKEILKNNLLKDEYDNEIIAYNNFINNIYKQIDSEIQHTFFGFKEEINIYKCCNLTTFSFIICKYIRFNIDKIKINDLQKLISNFENNYIPGQKYCSKCNKISEIKTQNKLIMNKILIIFIKNRNKMPMKFNTIIHTQKYEYKLISCITESKEGQNLNIIFNLKNTWYAIKNNENSKKEVGNDIGSLILYPCILFFEKGKKLNISQNNNLNKMSVKKKIVMDNNPKMMTNNEENKNIMTVNNNHLINNNNLNEIIKENNNQATKNQPNLNNNKKIPKNNLINNQHIPKINMNKNNNNQLLKENEAIIKTKNGQHIEKIEGNHGTKDIGINNLFPDTIKNNQINNIKDINSKNFNYDIIKNNQNKPKNQENKYIPVNNIEKNKLF